MSTIDSLDIIRAILQNNGTYPGDPQCYSVLTYQNAWGGTSCAITYSAEDANRYAPSEFIRHPHLLWARGTGLTPLGRAFLQETTGGSTL